MTDQIAVITTFPNYAWPIYGKAMMESFVKFWPAEIPLLLQLDDDCLAGDVQKLLRPEDAIAIGWQKEHKAFVDRNKDKDDKDNYRKQAVRFCHKVFAIKRALDAINEGKEAKEPVARYLIWMDADVITNKPVTMDDIKLCLPKEGDAVSYLGRKDWDHSECGWLAFDLENGGDKLINKLIEEYVTDRLFKYDQWHDSWIWDLYLKSGKSTNLTPDKPGMDIWPQSPMGKWSTHYKGPVAKEALIPKQKHSKEVPLQIKTMNAIPNPAIVNNIRTNQLLIKNWIRPCKPTDEEIIVVSAGPMLIAEDLRKEKGKIVAVKHALEPLAKAGIKPWACILLDPRDHVAKFVDNADKDIIWIVASQVDPEVVRRLLDNGCTVWGYHASVGAGEHEITKKQEYAEIHGGSATATRGLFALNHLGFKNFVLYGYDLCYPEKPDLSLRDEKGQPRFLEVSIGINHPLYLQKRGFWTEGQLVAQYQELNQLIQSGKMNIKAHGQGIVPFLVRSNELVDLRDRELKAKLSGTNIPTYEELLCCQTMECSKLQTTEACHNQARIPSSTIWGRLSNNSLLRQLRHSNS